MTKMRETTEQTQTTISLQCRDDEDWCHFLSPWECDHKNISNSCLQSCEKCENRTRGNQMKTCHDYITTGTEKFPQIWFIQTFGIDTFVF